MSPGRNAPCPCGSGRKYKRCCLARDEERALAARADAAPSPPVPDEDPALVRPPLFGLEG